LLWYQRFRPGFLAEMEPVRRQRGRRGVDRSGIVAIVVVCVAFLLG
jgi:hypothetical protein